MPDDTKVKDKPITDVFDDKHKQLVDYDNKIQELEEAHKKQIAELRVAREILNGEVANLNIQVSEIRKFTVPYANSYSKNSSTKASIDKFAESGGEAVDQGLAKSFSGEKISEIKAKVTKFEGELKKKKEAIGGLETSYKNAREAYRVAQEKLDSVQTKYDAAANYQNKIEKKLKVFSDLKKSIENEASLPVKYFLIWKLKADLETFSKEYPAIDDPTDFGNSFIKTFEELSKARSALKGEEEALKRAKNLFDNDKNALERFEADLIKNTIDELKKMS